MKMIVCLMISIVFLGIVFAAPTVSDLKVTPISPWGLAIDYIISGATDDDVDAPLVVQATGGDRLYTAKTLAGDTKWMNGAHRVYWNLATDGITANIQNGQVAVCYRLTYCVIDLTSRVNSANYPIAYLDSEPEGGFNATDYKTTKLVLKRVDAGSFIMGGDQSVESHRVTLTKPFYMGLFEVTQKQWELVMGSNPSGFRGDVRPVERVSYNRIRGSSQGAKWPASNAVDADSFLGKLRARTGIDFDLPTEAQWEYVCRAGTTTKFSYGNSADGHYMFYSSNTNNRTYDVGKKQSNPWGFYDLHGNVAEWCLDWYGNLNYGVNPQGGSSGFGRVLRGGSYFEHEYDCTSSSRRGQSPTSDGNDWIGFRLVWSLSE